MTDIDEFLSRFSQFSKECKELILSITDTIHIKKGSEIISMGKPDIYMYFIKQGAVRGFYVVDGKEETYSLWAENNVFGNISTHFDGRSSNYFYQAIEDCILLRINIKELRKLYETNLEICNQGRILAENSIILLEQERIFFRDKSAIRRYNNFLLYKPRFIERFKSVHIASFLGMTPETFSRIHAANLKKNKLTERLHDY